MAASDTSATAPAAEVHKRRPRRFTEGWWISIGLGVAATLVLALPLAVALAYAFADPERGWFAPDVLPPAVSIENWRRVLGAPGLIEATILSLFIATATTLLSAILSLPTAYALGRIPFRAKRSIEVFVLSPLIVPGIVIAVAVGELFFRMGLAYSIPGVVFVHAVGTLPFMIRILAAALEGLSDDVIHAARTVGAGPIRIGLHIVVPMVLPGFIAAGLLSFIRSFEEFEKTFIIGAPLVETLPIKLWSFLGGTKVVALPSAAIVTFLLLAPMLVIFFVAERMMNDRQFGAGLGRL